MRAAIVAVGSELLGSDRLDTNSLRLTRALRRHGVELARKAVVGDDEAEIGTEIDRALAVCDLVLVTGGLGPTADDVTREAVAETLGLRLEHDPEILADIEAKFRSFGMKMPAVNRQQADVPEGARVLPNARGTAPGLVLEHEGSTLFLFPGVPVELDHLMETALVPWLEGRLGSTVLESRYLKVACVGESALEERIAPFYDEFGRHDLTVLSSPGEITLGVTQRGEEDERRAGLRRRVERLRELLGDVVFGEGREASLEEEVGRLLRAAGRTLVTAESCTGGLISERLTRVPGSSEFYFGGAVTYADRLKVELLGVDPASIADHGAVSEPVAREMASGARRALDADYAVAVTGVAGPSGGSEEKPVGTVHIAVEGPEGARHRRLKLPGDRSRVRQLTSQWALDMVRREVVVELQATAAAR